MEEQNVLRYEYNADFKFYGFPGDAITQNFMGCCTEQPMRIGYDEE